MPIHSTPEGHDLHYKLHTAGDSARAQPMLMLHGLSQSHSSFNGLLDKLASNRQLIVCDLPGHGESYRPAQYQAEQMVEDVASLLQVVADVPAIVYGHSLGSLIAAGLAAEHPDLVSKLILSDPPLVVWDAPRWKKSIISSYFGWARKVLGAGYSTEQIIPMLAAAFPHRGEDVLKDQAIALSQLDIGIINALFDDELTTLETVLAQYAGVQCPTLIMQADPNILAAANDADIEAIQARIPDAQHIKFAGSDHDLHLWKPERILQAVTEFLDK